MIDYPCTDHVPADDGLSRCIRLTAKGRDPQQWATLPELAQQVEEEARLGCVRSAPVTVAVHPRTGRVIKWEVGQ